MVMKYFVVSDKLLFFTFVVAIHFCQVSSESCDFTIRENSSPNVVINDLKQSPNSSKYEYTLQGEPPFLTIEKLTGKLRFNRRIDREQYCRNQATCRKEFTVIKELINNSGPPKMSKYSLCIEDENDNSPQLPASHTLNINENTEINTSFSLPLAADEDSPTYSANHYGILCPEDILELKFQLHQVNRTAIGQDKVWIVLKKQLDRESKEKYECLVTVSDGQYQNQMTLYIQVKDYNDHAPQWTERNFEFRIPENEYYKRIVKLQADDADRDYGKIVYDFGVETKPKIRSYFDINHETGELRIVQKLDYEMPEQRVIYIPVVAKDNGEPIKSATATLTISLIDQNDNKPEFVKINNNMKIFEIKENEPSSSYLGYFTVTDKDSGDNGKVNCSIRRHVDDYFVLEKQGDDSYIIKTKVTFDRELMSEIHFNVDCRDMGNPPMTNSVRFKVIIIDVNDNNPHFTRKHFEGRILEGPYTSQNTILRVTAIDKDKDKELVYSIEPLVDFVSIDSKSGEIIPHRNFDRETQDNYTFHVKVVDKLGGENATDTATVTLLVDDINDNAPQFTGAFTFSVAEDARPDGQVVGQLNATDKDRGENGTIEFECLDCYKTSFQLTKNGQIILTKRLDRESEETSSLTVVARDKGRPSMNSPHSIVLLTVDDVNDNAPKFPKRYYHHNVSCDKGAIIMGIQATDKDKEPNNIIEYKIQNSMNSLFEVNNQSGEIRLKEQPDKRQCRDGIRRRITLVAYDPNPKYPKHYDTVYVDVKIRQDHYSGKKLDPNDSKDNDYGSYQGVNRMDVNLFIVVTLVCVAIILAVLMLGLIIFLKRRQDREHNNYSHNQNNTKKAKGTFQNSSTYPRNVYYDQNGTLICGADKVDPACVTLTSASLASSQVESRLSPHEALMCASSMSAEDLSNLDRETLRRNRETYQKPKPEHWISCEQTLNSGNPYETHFTQDIYHTYQRMPALSEEEQRSNQDSYTDLPMKYIINSSLAGSDTAYPKVSLKDNNNLKLSHMTNTIGSTRSIDNKGKNEMKKPYCTISFV